MSAPSQGAHLAAALAAASALAFGAAAPARGATTYACSGKPGAAVRLISRAARCGPHESRLAWATEVPAGRARARRLAPGASESGSFSARAGLAGEEVGIGVSFRRPLALAIAGGHAVFDKPGETSAHCPGAARADRGFLCVYTTEQRSLAFLRTLNLAPFELDSTGRFGFAAYFTGIGGHGFAAGTWTVTEA